MCRLRQGLVIMKKPSGVPIRISDDLYKIAKQESKLSYRTIPQQIAYWAAIGRYLENNPDKTVADCQL